MPWISASEIMEFINRIGHEESAKLAVERGPFPNWAGSIYKDGPPLRNATVTTIAPTGTISIIAGAPPGIEPLFAIAFRHIVGDRQLTFVNPHFEQRGAGAGLLQRGADGEGGCARAPSTGSRRSLRTCAAVSSPLTRSRPSGT